MNKQKQKYNGWPNTIYFDGFAGSGSRDISNSEESINEQKCLLHII